MFDSDRAEVRPQKRAVIFLGQGDWPEAYVHKLLEEGPVWWIRMGIHSSLERRISRIPQAAVVVAVLLDIEHDMKIRGEAQRFADSQGAKLLLIP